MILSDPFVVRGARDENSSNALFRPVAEIECVKVHVTTEECPATKQKNNLHKDGGMDGTVHTHPSSQMEFNSVCLRYLVIPR